MLAARKSGDFAPRLRDARDRNCVRLRAISDEGNISIAALQRTTGNHRERLDVR
jgi:hypothetical protein